MLPLALLDDMGSDSFVVQFSMDSVADYRRGWMLHEHLLPLATSSVN
jgi:hypothetical protein